MRVRGETPELMAGAPPFPAEGLVTLANWQEPPCNRWAFQHIRDLIPTARIRRPMGRLEPEAGDLTGIRFRAERRKLTIEQRFGETSTDVCLVLHEGASSRSRRRASRRSPTHRRR